MSDVRFPAGTSMPRPLVYVLVPAGLLGVVGMAVFPVSALLGVVTAGLLPVWAALRGRPC